MPKNAGNREIQKTWLNKSQDVVEKNIVNI